MDVDEDENAAQRPKKVQDYGIEVDFDSLDEETRENGSAEYFEKEILRLNTEIERMAPNLKAIERCDTTQPQGIPPAHVISLRLDDVEAKLAETEREADKARKDSKNARDEFADVKKRR
jgi:structural maintenance of chromosome 1